MTDLTGSRKRPLKPLTERTCEVCAGGFLAKRIDARFCSDRCAEKLRGCCNASDCERGVRARGMCAMHWRRWNRAQGNESSPWDDRRRNNYHARRARLNGGRNGDPVLLAEVIERDAGMCGLCAGPVDFSAEWPASESKSLDHVVPLSRGGSHDIANVQLAHLGCNVSKGAKVLT